MPVIEWNKNFELGIDEFDEQHRHLICLLNEAYANFIGEASKETINGIIDSLFDYATYHFCAEEHWMGLHGYGGLGKHRDEHNEFSRRIVEIQYDSNREMKHVSIELLAFLRNWLIDHILQTDADYCCFASGLIHD